VLRRIFGPKKDEVTEDWMDFLNEELHNLCSSVNIMIKLRRMTLAGHVVRMGRRGMHIRYWWKIQEERAIRKAKTHVGGEY
jgi:transcription initiation factor IIE alpha subunit